MFNAVRASLVRLETPYLDLLQIHRYDYDVQAEETMKAPHDLVQNGKVRYIGASSRWRRQFAHLNDVARKNGWTTFASLQAEYSLLYREEVQRICVDRFERPLDLRTWEREMLAYCNFNGIGVVPWAPLSGGALARPRGAESVRLSSVKGTAYERSLRPIR